MEQRRRERGKRRMGENQRHGQGRDMGNCSVSSTPAYLVRQLIVQRLRDHFVHVLSELPRLHANNILQLCKYKHGKRPLHC